MTHSTPRPNHPETQNSNPEPPAPKVVHLDMLDTDYAKLMAGEPIPEARKYRLEAGSHTYTRLSKQIARYRHGKLDQQGRDDILCSIGTVADLFTPADIEEFNDRLRTTNRFYLTPGERQQVVNWLEDELTITLEQSS
ncbi:MAG: hypothetical protein AAGF66_04170 [Cyanobacteria bacterium P01_H01_bin.119]